MGRSLISSSNSRSLLTAFDLSAQQQNHQLSSMLGQQTTQVNTLLNQQKTMSKQLVSSQDQLKYLIKLGLGETPPDLVELNEKKTELITIMNDYLTQKVTRVDTVNKLTKLETKIA
jgi:small-conductance mechanosensitive channel